MQLIKKVFTVLNILIYPIIISAQAPFVTTWKTDNPGTSAPNQIAIPAGFGTFNYDVDWENDGIFDDIGLTGSVTHTYTSAGTYQIAIQGNFPSISFANTGDQKKLLSIDQWGNISWESMLSAFEGCTNLNISAIDAPDLSNVTNMFRMFKGATSLNQDLNSWNMSNVTRTEEMFLSCSSFNGNISGWDMSSVTNMRAMFTQCNAFSGDLSSWNTLNVENMSGMFFGCFIFNSDISSWNVISVIDMSSMLTGTSFDQDISSWDVSLVTNFTDFLSSTDMSIANYDALLTSWSNLPNLQTNINFGASNLEYCNGGMDRQVLIDDFNWIFDGDSENCASCSHPDYDAMIDLYTSTNGAIWTNNTGWIDGFAGTNCDACSWFGITCVNNRVTEIDLSNNGLTGLLPDNLDGITELEKLIVNNNSIGGDLPSDYSNLPNFILFEAAYNNLTGGIPTEYCSFVAASGTSLQTNFTFSNNELSDCYDDALDCFCGVPLMNAKISNGNDFPVPFSAFCATGDGDCSDNCMDLDGNNDHLRVLGLSTTPDFTIMAWFKAAPVTNGGTEDRIVTFGINERLEIGIEQGGADDGEMWIFDHEYSSSPVALGTQVRDGEWHHFALTRNGTAGEFYLDGTSIFAYTANNPSAGYGPDFYVGRWPLGSSNTEFFGQIDDVALFDVALSAADITTIQTCELNGSEAGLLGFWDFNVGESEMDNTNFNTTGILDDSGNGNVLSVFNMTMDGPTSNLVTSTTGLYNTCNICYSQPAALCNSGQTYIIDTANPAVTISVTDIDNGSNSPCGGTPTLSFDQAGTITSITYDCMEPSGQKTIELWVTDDNGVQSSCSSTFTFTRNLPVYEALEAIYNSTDGDNWTNTIAVDEPWLVDCDPCGLIDGTPWHGITCVNGLVERLNLYNNGLDGTLPDVFNVFDNMEWFLIGGNEELEGLLPSSFCEMSSLIQINISNSGLMGNIPNLPGTSPLPEYPNCFTLMENLAQINAQNTSLSGNLPDIDPTNQTLVENLLFENEINSGQYNGQFTGDIPPNYGLLNNLMTLRTYGNSAMQGCYHPNLLNLCDSPNFTTSSNSFISLATGLEAWEDFCDRDYELALLADFYNSTGGNEWLSTQNGDKVWFENCLPCGDASQNINPWFGLSCNSNNEVLQLNMILGNNLDGTLPSSLGDFSALNWIALSGNPNLHGTIPEELCDLTGNIGPNGAEGLRLLQITTADLNGPIPSCFSDLEYLEALSLSGNYNLYGTLPAFDQNNQALEIINIYGTNISGSIPQSYIDIPNLNTLQVQFNNLTGTIPPFGPNQPDLEILNFHGNYLSGNIPNTIANISSLTSLQVYGNQGSFTFTDPVNPGYSVSGGSIGLTGCYGPLLTGLCQNTNLNLTDSDINAGNPLLGSWDAYCQQGLDRCCPDELIINWTPVLDGTYSSFGDIIIQSSIPPSVNVTLNHGTDQLNSVIFQNQTTVGNMSNITIGNSGCN